MPKQSSTAVDQCKGAINRVDALKLRSQGLTFKEIGNKLGVSEERARQIIKDELGKLHDEAAELRYSLRSKRLRQLGGLLDGYLVLAMAGDRKSLESVLKIMDREAKFLGMDEPTKTQAVADTNPYADMSLDDLKDEAKRRGIQVESDMIKPSNLIENMVIVPELEDQINNSPELLSQLREASKLPNGLKLLQAGPGLNDAEYDGTLE